MGRQTRFYLVHSDFRSLLRHAQESGLSAMPQIVATEDYDRRGHVEAVPPLEFPYGTEAGAFYLVPRDVPTVEVFYHEFKRDRSRSYLASQVSPVIEIRPCRRRGDRLSDGRIYTNAPRQGPGSDLVHKAYDRLARRIRRWPQVTDGVYVGPVTFERLRREEIRLMVINRPLEVDVDQAPPVESSPRIEWVEIPAGEFTQGLTDEQRSDIAERLHAGYGIGQLAPELQAWIEATMRKPRSAYSPAEDEIWRREVLRVGSPALAYQHARWALDQIPSARRRWLPTFYVARFPITRAQAASFYGSNIATGMGWEAQRRPGGGGDTEDRPAMFPEWEQAQAMAHWLGGRLPTPLEWEKAARGTDGRLYPWGDEWDPAAGHFRTPECHDGSARRTGRTTAVDAYPEGASPYGVMDMVGNLSEWHALTRRNDVGRMGFSNKEMSRVNPWFFALPMHARPGTRRQPARHVGGRPVLEEWGRRLWPGHRPELD